MAIAGLDPDVEARPTLKATRSSSSASLFLPRLCSKSGQASCSLRMTQHPTGASKGHRAHEIDLHRHYGAGSRADDKGHVHGLAGVQQGSYSLRVNATTVSCRRVVEPSGIEPLTS